MSALNAIPYDTNVSNFVSVKLSGKKNYLLWKAQMLCLLKSVNVYGILDNTFVGPKDSDAETMTQYDNLVRGWIFGSVTEDVLVEVFNLGSAKAVWGKLQSNYDPPKPFQEDSTPKESDAKTETEDRDAVSVETSTVDEGAISIHVIEESEIEETELETKNEVIERKKKLKKLKSHLIKGDWPELHSMLKEDEGLATEAISSDGSTILHIAVGIRRNDIVKKLFCYITNNVTYTYINEAQVLKKRNSDGSTALHIAAIVGNKEAAGVLLETNRALLDTRDNNGHLPWRKAYENMHLDTIAYFLEKSSVCGDEIDYVNLIVNAISAKQYSLASEFLKQFPKAASKSDQVLMALIKTFPGGLDDREKLFYPSLKSILEMLRKTTLVTVYIFAFPAIVVHRSFGDYTATCGYVAEVVGGIIFSIFIVPICMLASAFAFICLLVLIVCFPFLILYYLLWKGAKILAFAPINKIENKIMEREEAKKFLALVCDEIDQMNYRGSHHPFYTRPILEAACQNAYYVVEEILSRSPEAIQSKDESGYDIIQLAIANRSEKIYNLIYDVDERKNMHKTYEDSSKNNILHLAARLAPLSVLNQRRGAALQLQRELQWLEEVEKLVIPIFITQENIFKETPDMVFTREHMDLVKDGEQWMKTTAESCSITAALITTIVFAAAITVPGGSNQDKGTPLFKKELAFIIFAISDAISLFASSTSLLVFLSILTARFAEKDFLVNLPWRLFIGLFSLLLSTTAMMVAFSATVFLVFCDRKLWMLAPICGLAFIPIAFFVGLQFPLMIDLFSSTYLPIFGKERKASFKNIIRKTYEFTLEYATISS
ncbi:putative ankyrin repeat-containing domain, PGG domain, ankyrin repeat-containing domain superfamily [Helianthus debilis subsp. tardiflorus]